MKPLLEIAAFNLESAIIAAQAGADRIELCIDQSQGGLTPPPGMIGEARAQLTCPFFVMIRPEGGGFIYTDAVITVMKEELAAAKSLGADGFVFGILNEDGTVNETANSELISLANPLPCTFHRAFDEIEDKVAALEVLIRCGFQRVLTSGGVGNAVDFCAELKQLVNQAGDRIIIMPGGGVRSTNLTTIREQTGAKEYHSAAIINKGSTADSGAIREMQQLLG